MNLQIIKSTKGRPEYVLLPIKVYAILRSAIDKELVKSQEDYVNFDVADYVDNPIALARVRARITQQKLAELVGVTQAYISKVEGQTTVSHKLLSKVNDALAKLN